MVDKKVEKVEEKVVEPTAPVEVDGFSAVADDSLPNSYLIGVDEAAQRV